MNLATFPIGFFLALAANSVAFAGPKPLDMEAASVEVSTSYSKATPEVQEFVLHTARSFGRSGLWLNENAYSDLKPEEREARITYLAKLFDDAEYGRHLCSALAEASALKDQRLVSGLNKVASYHRADKDYDCRPKWMATAALARQESPDAVPLLVSLVDHGNQNTRFWARASLARMAKDDFKADKQAWNKWWVGQGHRAIDTGLLKPYTPPLAQEPKDVNGLKKKYPLLSRLDLPTDSLPQGCSKPDLQPQDFPVEGLRQGAITTDPRAIAALEKETRVGDKNIEAIYFAVYREAGELGVIGWAFTSADVAEDAYKNLTERDRHFRIWRHGKSVIALWRDTGTTDRCMQQMAANIDGVIRRYDANIN